MQSPENRSAGQKVNATSLQLSRTRSGQHKPMPQFAFYQAMNQRKQLRNLLYLVNHDNAFPFHPLDSFTEQLGPGG